MITKKNQSESWTRREFVLASGLLVAGGLISCSEPTKKQTVTIPKKPVMPIDIRVRIGKQVKKIEIGDHVYTHKSLNATPTTVEVEPNTIIKIMGKPIIITGAIVLHPTISEKSEKEKTFDVVAHVPVEQYLPGVLAGELFAHWHFDTFAAQAVAARSYAITQHHARKNKSHFDVTNTAASQMFLGDITLDVAHRATKATAGVVLMWNNETIPAYYSACCGGLAATATDAISGAAQHDIPPLQGHLGVDCCTTLQSHKWAASRSARVLRKRINASAKTLNLAELEEIRTIKSIEPMAVNQHGRPTSLVIKGRKNENYVVRARDFVRAINAPIQSLPKITEQAWSSHLVGEKTRFDIQLTGFGMGHGVGLCQYGAQELAGRGESWQNILAWYYPQAQITI
jgi:stage II sporulation protein D